MYKLTFSLLILTAFAFALLYQVLISHIFMAGFAEVEGPANVRNKGIGDAGSTADFRML